MNSTIFIAGGNPVTNQIIDLYISQGKQVIAAAFGEENSKEEASVEGLLVTYPWIPGSSLSPRNILLQGTRDQGEAERAFLVYATGNAGDAFHKTSSASIQRLIDQKVKSYLFFLKELISYYVNQRQGNLSVILQSEPGSLRDPINAGAYGMFRSLVTASQQAYEHEPFQLSLYETSSEDVEGFIDYIATSLNENPKEGNRVYPYPPKGGFFSRGGLRRG